MSGKIRNPARRCKICGGKCKKQFRYCKLCTKERRVILTQRRRDAEVSPERSEPRKRSLEVCAEGVEK